MNEEGIVARILVSLALFTSVIALAGAATVGGLAYTAEHINTAVTGMPVKSYALTHANFVAEFPATRAADLDIAKSVPVAQSLSQEPGPLAVSPAPTFTHTVAVESLRVRASPNKTARQLFSLRGGTQVTVFKEEQGWLLINAGGDRVGWVYKTLLRPATEQLRLPFSNGLRLSPDDARVFRQDAGRRVAGAPTFGCPPL
jgi:uncharacterized protein YgiM (DUF1202 family)